MTTLAQKISIHPVSKEIVAVARAAKRAGISEEQSILVARMALEIAYGGDAEYAPNIAAGIVQQARREHAAKHPNGKWARLFARHGEAKSLFMDANSETARNWHQPHAEGTAAYYLEKAAEAKAAEATS
jgi:hypothetical protein